MTKRSSKTPTEKRQAAIDAYKAAHNGRAPTKSMSIKAMNIAVERVDRSHRDMAARLQTVGSGEGVAGQNSRPAPPPPGAGLVRAGRSKAASAVPSMSHKPVWNDVRDKGSSGPAVAPSAANRVGQAYNTFNRFATPVATGVMAAQQFRVAKARGESNVQAAREAVAVALPGQLAMVAKPVGSAMSNFGSSAMSLGFGLFKSSGITDWALGLPVAKAGGLIAAGGAVAKVAGEGLKVAGRVAAPAMVAYGAYRGAQADSNKVRGAVRGAIGALDPSGIVTNVGAATGMMSDPRGLGQRAFDAAFGKASSAPGQASNSFNVGQFVAANSKFEQGRPAGDSGSGKRQGWSNEARAGAYVARMTNAGKAAENIPYGLPAPEPRR